MIRDQSSSDRRSPWMFWAKAWGFLGLPTALLPAAVSRGLLVLAPLPLAVWELWWVALAQRVVRRPNVPPLAPDCVVTAVERKRRAKLARNLALAALGFAAGDFGVALLWQPTLGTLAWARAALLAVLGFGYCLFDMKVLEHRVYVLPRFLALMHCESAARALYRAFFQREPPAAVIDSAGSAQMSLIVRAFVTVMFVAAVASLFHPVRPRLSGDSAATKLASNTPSSTSLTILETEIGPAASPSPLPTPPTAHDVCGYWPDQVFQNEAPAALGTALSSAWGREGAVEIGCPDAGVRGFGGLLGALLSRGEEDPALVLTNSRSEAVVIHQGFVGYVLARARSGTVGRVGERTPTGRGEYQVVVGTDGMCVIGFRPLLARKTYTVVPSDFVSGFIAKVLRKGLFPTALWYERHRLVLHFADDSTTERLQPVSGESCGRLGEMNRLADEWDERVGEPKGS